MKFVDELKNLKNLKDETVKGIESSNDEKEKEANRIIRKIAEEKYDENVHPILDRIDGIREKGTFILNITISTTMGPGIKVDKNSFDI